MEPIKGRQTAKNCMYFKSFIIMFNVLCIWKKQRGLTQLGTCNM